MFRFLSFIPVISMVVVSMVVITGCGPGGIPVNYVEGTVTLDSAPVENATVSFSPVAGGTGKAASGITDSKGVFKLSAAESSSIGGGTAVGEYLVAVIKNPPQAAAEDPEAWKTDPNYGKVSNESHSKPTLYVSDVPAAYGSSTTSGLTASVKAGSNKDLKFELKKDFKPKK